MNFSSLCAEIKRIYFIIVLGSSKSFSIISTLAAAMFHNLGVFCFFIATIIIIVFMGKSPFVVGYPLNPGHCPEVGPMRHFDIFAMLGSWYVALYYSSSEEALTYRCMKVQFGLSEGNMDMRMALNYRYVNNPNEDEVETGNMTWQIPDPRRPEHWLHSEDHYKGIYSTDVVDTDYQNWLILLHCSDPESHKKFLSTFVFSRIPTMDKMTTEYLRDKISYYDVELEYLFPVNQTNCYNHEKTNEETGDQPTSPSGIKMGAPEL